MTHRQRGVDTRMEERNLVEHSLATVARRQADIPMGTEGSRGHRRPEAANFEQGDTLPPADLDSPVLCLRV